MKILVLTLIVLLMFFLTKNLIESSNAQVIKIPESEITENAKWYEYEKDGIKIRFFAVKASDGSIKTAFDACDICYKSKKGYSQDGNYIVCNNCGNKYLIDDLGSKNKVSGGCWPGYLPNSLVGNDVVIKKSDIEKGIWRFK
ncbi:MAG: DUF2318 domain-containing protein [candidate division WOR-3 bacterium]